MSGRCGERGGDCVAEVLQQDRVCPVASLCCQEGRHVRHSAVSPTHSNGLASGPSASNVRKRSSLAGASRGSSPANTAASSARSIYGARIRSMKQHLSQRPHQWSSRWAGSWLKARLQLRNTRWYCGESGELRGDPQLAAGPQVGEDGESRTEARVDDVGEGALELLTLRPLVVDGVRPRPPLLAPRPTTHWTARPCRDLPGRRQRPRRR